MKPIMVFRVVFGSLFLALLFSATGPIPAFADEGDPPTDPVPTEAPTFEAGYLDSSSEPKPEAADQPNSADEVEVPTSDEEPPLVNDPSEMSVLDGAINFELVSVAPSTGNTVDPSIGDLEDELPDASETIEIVVTDESGDPLPLASEEASEIMTTGDPIWCPASVTIPKPNTGGCTASFDSLADLFAELAAQPKTVDGTIWIEKDYNSTVDATLDGGSPSLATMRNFKLTLKGGWNGCGANPPATCVGTIDTLNPSEINHQVSILAWNNDVTLNDLLITGVADSGDALGITTTGKIVVTRVTVSENDGAGASLDNTAGTKDVYITASNFNKNNGGDGLVVSSRGLITLKDVTAATNGADGADLNNATSPSMLGVMLLGTNIFSENIGSGLMVTSSGPINLSNLVNNANGSFGAQLNNTSATKANAIMLSGSNQFKLNGAGLSILSDGPITLNNVTANNNSSYGADLNNTSSSLGSGVTLNGINYFNENYVDGLIITSAGVVSLNKTTANSNGQGGLSGYGAQLVNTAAISAKSIAISASMFNDNFGGGLLVNSDGAISISSLIAIENGGNGAELVNISANPVAPQNVTLTNSVNTSHNEGIGLQILSLGSISVVNLVASNNQSEGVSLDNSIGSLPRAITISGNTLVVENHATGLLISSKGSITLNNISVMGNVDRGAILNNAIEGASGAVSVTGKSYFSVNGDIGLEVVSRGNILISNIKATENAGIGVKLDNAVTGLQGTISLGSSLANWCNEFSENDESGLEITSNGTVTLSNVCATTNGSFASPGYGVSVNNSTATLPKAVNINGVNSFIENYSGGLQISSTGSIKISNLTASNNLHGFGALLDNTSSTVNKPQSISLTGSNHIVANYDNGLKVKSYGTITVNNLTASSNGANGGSGYGAWLDNCGLIEGEGEEPDHCFVNTPQPVSLTGRSSISSNHGEGLQIFSLGLIKLNNITASSNEEIGAYVNNDFSGAIGGITITGTGNTFSGNANGLEINTRRAISISNLEASANTGFGANLTNFANPPSPQNITITGYALFEGNQSGYGLSARSLGAITIANLNAAQNGEQGAILDNAEAAATGGITLSGIQVFSENGAAGLEITSNRAVTISNLKAELNDGYGTSIDNTASNQSFDVKITGVNAFNENDHTGLEVKTFGGITLSSVTANGNGFFAEEGDGNGVNLENHGNALFAKPITLMGISLFSANFEDGFRAISRGPIQASSLAAGSNLGSGVVLDNHLGMNTVGITLTGASLFQGNSVFGLSANSRGTISVANLTAHLNQESGVQLDNSGSAAAKDVIVSGTNVFNENGLQETEPGSGLIVKSLGRITLYNATANGNGAYGTWLSNFDSNFGTPAVTIAGSNFFTANGFTGLYVQSAGDINLSKIVSDNNSGDGLVAIGKKNINLTCASFTGNDGTGIWTSASFGTVTLKGVFAYGNSVNFGWSALKIVESRGCPMP